MKEQIGDPFSADCYLAMSSRGYVWAWSQRIATPPKIVLLALAERGRLNDEGVEEAWPGIPRLVEDTGLSESTVRRALAFLEEQQLITVDVRYKPNGGRMTNRYILNFETATSEAGPPVTVTPSPRQGDTTPLSQEHHPPVTVTSITKEEPLTEPPIESVVRGTRIPRDFAITDSMRSWATDTVPSVDITFETEQFVDYWTAIPGAKGRKADWTRAWQTWMRGEEKKIHPRRASPPPPERKPFAYPDPERWGL